MLKSDFLQLIDANTPLILWLSNSTFHPEQKYFQEVDYLTDGLIYQCYLRQKNQSEHERELGTELFSVPQFQKNLTILYRRYHNDDNESKIAKDLMEIFPNINININTNMNPGGAELKIIVINLLSISLSQNFSQDIKKFYSDFLTKKIQGEYETPNIEIVQIL